MIVAMLGIASTTMQPGAAAATVAGAGAFPYKIGLKQARKNNKILDVENVTGKIGKAVVLTTNQGLKVGSSEDVRPDVSRFFEDSCLCCSKSSPLRTKEAQRFLALGCKGFQSVDFPSSPLPPGHSL